MRHHHGGDLHHHVSRGASEPTCDIRGIFRCNGAGAGALVTGDGDWVLNTHNFRRETGAVGKVNNRVIEVKQIRLVVRLELMKEVEDLESEDGVRPNQRGREPFPPKQLSTTILGIRWIAPTVSNNGLVDAANIESGELITPGGVRTRLASPVTKLHHKAEGGEGFGGKELTVPPLHKNRMSNRVY